MTTNADRGRAIAERLERLGLTKHAFWLASKKVVDRETISRALNGDESVRPSTYGKIEGALERLWDEIDMDGPDAGSVAISSTEGLISVQLFGHSGVRAIVKGPVTDMAALKDTVSHVLREMNISPEGDAEDST